MPADSRTLDDEGVVIPPTRLDRGRAPRARPDAGCATRASARPTCARSWPPTAPAAARGRPGRALRDRHRSARRCDETLDYAERRTRARIEELEDGRRARHATCSRRRDGDLELRLRATVRGDELTLDFTGSADQHDGNLNCPLAVTLSACYFAVRVLTDPDVPPCAGAYRPVTVIAPEGSLLNARPPARGGGRQRRDLLARGRPRAGRLRPRARPGHDEQPHARQRRLHLLRDARRRPGRLPGRRRPERGARGDVEHAEHAGRGARARVPAARGGVLGAARLGRRRRATAAATAWCASSRRSTRCATR